MFETPRLILRGFRSLDADLLHAAYNVYDVQLTAATDYVVPRPEAFRDTIVERTVSKSTLFAIIEEKETGAFVGHASLRVMQPKDRDAEVGLMVAKEKWGKGYGGEVMEWLVGHAFRGLGMHRVSLVVYATNERAVRLYKKIGFVQEGVTRKGVWIEGRWVDVILMGILEDDYWESQQKKEGTK